MNLAFATGPTIDLGDGALLRPVTERDVTDAYVNGLNDPEVHRFLVAPRRQRQTREMVVAFVEQNLAAADGILFGLFIDARLCGTVRLHDIRNGQAWLGLALFDRAIWGRGWARRAIVGVAQFAARDLRVEEIRAGIAQENVGSRKAFAASGFLHLTGADRATEFGVAETWCWHADPGRVQTTSCEVSS